MIEGYYSILNDLSNFENPSKNAEKRSMACWTSWDPAISLMECIDSIGFPTSTVRKPSLLNIGPTVEPQGLYHRVSVRAIADR